MPGTLGAAGLWRAPCTLMGEGTWGAGSCYSDGGAWYSEAGVVLWQGLGAGRTGTLMGGTGWLMQAGPGVVDLCFPAGGGGIRPSQQCSTLHPGRVLWVSSQPTGAAQP